MRRHAQVKALAAGAPLRKTAVTASSAGRRSFPAWIDASESTVAFAARGVTPRVRDGLVLRTVAKRTKKSVKPGRSADGHGAR